jgi:hypothetical protein
MKTNGMLLVVYAMLSFILTAGIMMGDIISWNGLICFALSFSFWFLMLLGAWELPKKQDTHKKSNDSDPIWDTIEEVRERDC